MKYFFLSFLLAITGAGYAQQERPLRLSLADCMDYAMKHSYTVRNAQLDVLIQEVQNSQTTSSALPSVSGKYEFNYFPRPQQSFLNARTFSSTAPDVIVPVAFTIPFSSTASLSASQVLFDGSLFVALQARKAVMELAKRKAEYTQEELRYNIYKTYYSCAITAQQFNILTTSIAYLRSITHELEVTYQSGLVEKIEVERLNVQLNNLINDSLTTVNGLRLNEQVLKYQMGMDIETPIELTDNDVTAHATSALKVLADQIDYKSIGQYKLATTGVLLREYDLKRYHLAAIPSIVGIGGFGNNYGAEKFKDIFKIRSYESYSIVGLQANVNIFGGFKRQYQVKEAKLNLEKSKNDLENTKLGIDFQAAQARTSLRNALLQLKSQDQNLELAKDVLQLAQKKYKAGVGSNLEVTTAQSEELKTRNSYFVTLLNIINAEADLKKSLGMFN